MFLGLWQGGGLALLSVVGYRQGSDTLQKPLDAFASGSFASSCLPLV